PTLAGKRSDQPFPCMDHACGCHDAEQCWRSCCCFTAKERIAWAQAHGVIPPLYAELPRHEENAKACGHSASACQRAHLTHEHHDTSSGSRWVVSVAPLTCKGLSTALALSGLAVPPPGLICWMPLLPLVGHVSSAPVAPQDLSLSPPSPPPR